MTHARQNISVYRPISAHINFCEFMLSGQPMAIRQFYIRRDRYVSIFCHVYAEKQGTETECQVEESTIGEYRDSLQLTGVLVARYKMWIRNGSRICLDRLIRVTW